MSLVSTYVESQERHWYRNPVIYGDVWFICWDDDDPIELVIMLGTKSVSEILTGLRKLGWDLVVLNTGERSSRFFTRNFDSKPRPAQSYFLRQNKGGPTDKLLEGNERLKKKPHGQGVYYVARDY